MHAGLPAYLLVAVTVIVVPGPDTALTIRNAVRGGRAAGVRTALGVVTGQGVWAGGASAGIVALLTSAQPALQVLRAVGAGYLVILGTRAIVDAIRDPGLPPAAPSVGRSGHRSAYRQGLASNLANPKIAVFFAALLPQFAHSPAEAVGLGVLFMAMTLSWLTMYAVVVGSATAWFGRRRVRRCLAGVSGTALVALGARLGVEAASS
jgi:threonine/homoserine/homoserine lactone efflux protein